MSAALSIIERLEALGYSFALHQCRLTASLPTGYAVPQKAAALLEELRSQRAEALSILQRRADEQDGFQAVVDYEAFAPITMQTFVIVDALAIKQAMDAREIVLAGQVEYCMASGAITINYRPLVPPDWINLQLHREAAQRANKARMDTLLHEYDNAPPERWSSILLEYKCLSWAVREVMPLLALRQDNQNQ